MPKGTLFDITNPQTITDNVKYLGLNSLDVINIVVAFEEEFNVEIPEDGLVNLVTVGDIVDYLRKCGVN